MSENVREKLASGGEVGSPCPGTGVTAVPLPVPDRYPRRGSRMRVTAITSGLDSPAIELLQQAVGADPLTYAELREIRGEEAEAEPRSPGIVFAAGGHTVPSWVGRGGPFPLVVIGRTAQHALAAFDAGAIAFVQWPAPEEAVRAACARALAAHERSHLAAAVDRLRMAITGGDDKAGTSRPVSQYTVLGTRGGTTVVSREDIIAAVARHGRVELRLRHGTRVIRASMAALERQLAPWGFWRTHRRCLVARSAVAELCYSRGRLSHLLLQDGTELPVSRTYRDLVEERLGDDSPAIPVRVRESPA